MDRGELEILMGRSIVLNEIKAEVPLQNENSMRQQYIERIESPSPEGKVSRFCKEAGFMRIVEVGQNFITKHTGDLRQFRSVACREYTLPRDDPASQPKGWIQGNMRIGLVLEVTTRFQYDGIEIRIWSVGQDNSQSWVRISYGTNKHVIYSNHHYKEILADPHEDQRSQTSVKVIAARSKAKAKPQKREPVDTPSIVPMHERKQIYIEPSDCFKTPILQEILRIQNPLLEEHCALLEVTHLFQEVGCARNKLPFHTVQLNLKSSLWTLD